MSASPDRQLGVDLRLCRPSGPLTAQMLEGILRDLVGGDPSLLAPLLHVVGLPAFLRLDPAAISPAERLLTREQLIGDLGSIYHARVLDRLRSFLDGYLNLDGPVLSAAEVPAPGLSPLAAPGSPLASGDTPAGTAVRSDGNVPAWLAAPVTPGAASAPATAAGQVGPPPAWLEPAQQAAAPVAPSAGSPGQPAWLDSAPAAPPTRPQVASAQPPRGRSRRLAGRPLILLGALLLTGTAIALASEAPRWCRQLGWCPAAAPAAAPADVLAAASRAAGALEAARDLAAHERALADLDRQLQRLQSEGLTAGQKRQRETLQATARDGQARRDRERSQAQALATAQSRIAALASLPSERQQPERLAIRQLLTAIPAGSFAHAAAQLQLQRLDAPAAEPAAEAGGPAAEPAPPPAPPGGRPSGGGLSGGGPSAGGWRAPGRPSRPTPAPAPAPAPERESDGGEKAPVPMDERDADNAAPDAGNSRY